MRIRFDKIDGFFKAHGGEFGHLVLFDCLIYGLSDKICEKSKYLISEKSGITDSINHNFGKIRIDSYNSLSIEKILAFYKVIMLIKSVANKSKNYYYNIFLEKGLYKDKSDTWYTIFLNDCLYIYKCCISIELTFLRELMSIRQVHPKSVIFVTIAIS